ncbi:hypothetical protein BT08F33_43500 [Escherichia coli]
MDSTHGHEQYDEVPLRALDACRFYFFLFFIRCQSSGHAR